MRRFHIAEPPRGLRPAEVGFDARVVVDVGFRHLGQPPVRTPFFVECFLQQPRFVGTVETPRVRARTAVRRDLVVLDALGRANDRRVAGVVCRGFSQTIVGFLNNPGEPGATLRRHLLAPVREDQLEALEVETRFVAVLRQRFLQFRRVCRIGEARQRPNQLPLRVVQVAKLVEVEVLQRCDSHT